MAEETPQKPRRLWKVIFALSLAMNLAVVGLIAGVGLRSAGGKPPHTFEFGLGPIGQAMTKDQRREMGRQLRTNSDLREFGREQARRMLTGIVEALRAETFDADLLREAMMQADGRRATLQTTAREAFIAQIGEMSLDERSALADRLEEGVKQRRRH